MASSSQTTEILFNSPALHSLKRDQLVKLCKIHSIKASGKNVELIERLKKVAEGLPKDAPLSIAARSDVDTEGEEDDEKENLVSPVKNVPRWEAMDTIEECDNEAGTLKSREFGTADSKSSAMSSIKALASSLGIKRGFTPSKSHAIANDPLTHVPRDDPSLFKHATPYTSIAIPPPSQMPQTDHFSDFAHYNTKPPSAATLSKFDFNNKEETAPLPGHVLRPGEPAPENARLSMGNARFSLGQADSRKSTSGPTTTIRLVSSSSSSTTTASTNFLEPFPSAHAYDGGTPQLKPLNTTFDLILASPSGPGENVKIYPDLPMEDVIASPTKPVRGTLPGDLPPGTPPRTTMPEPFIFGSPDPQHRVSDAQFQTAAASVLKEMNQRLVADGVDTVGSPLIHNLRPGSRAELIPNSSTNVHADREIRPLRKSYGANTAKREVQAKFEKAHSDHFAGMESIAGYLDRKNNNRGQVADDEPVQVGKKRKSSVLGDAGGTSQQQQAKGPSNSNNTRRVAIPGGFGDDDEDEEEGAPSGKKAKVEFSPQDAEEKEKEKAAVEKEREVIRRKLEMNRAKRRSSAANGRASMGRGRASVGRNSVLQKPPPKTPAKSRFGFLSSAAKSIVKNVWGSSKKASAAPKPPPATTLKPVGETTSNESTRLKGKMAPPSDVKRKVSTAGRSSKSGTATPGTPTPSSSTSSSHRNVSNTGLGTGGGSTSSRAALSRNATASNTGTMSSLGSIATTIHSTESRSRVPSFAAPTASSSIRSHSSTATSGTASTRNSSIASRAAAATSSSMAETSALPSATSGVSSLSSRTSGSSSRLLAPTASSLAKTAAVNRLKSATLNVPSNKPALPSSPSPPNTTTTTPGTPGKIFSKPLVIPLRSGIPSPVRNATKQQQPQRALSGRKPRISRSKVIAKLAEQRAAASVSGSGPGSGGPSAEYTGPSAVGLAAKRSSLGVGVHKAPRKSVSSVSGARKSHAGVPGTRNSEASVLLSAKKRVRQSEYARRRSRVAAGRSSVGGRGHVVVSSDNMEVDE